MYLIPTHFTNHHQPRVGSIPFGTVTALWAALRCVVGMDFGGHAAHQRRFITHEGLQLCKAPLATATLGRFRFLAGFGIAAAFCTLSDIGQILKSYQRLRETSQQLLRQRVVPIRNKPSFPSTQGNQSSGCGTGAFALEGTSCTSKTVFYLAGAAPRLKHRAALIALGDQVIPLSHVYTNHCRVVSGLQVWKLNVECNNQVILLFAALVIEFGSSCFNTPSNQVKVFLKPVILKDKPSRQRANADFLTLFPRVVTPILVFQRARDELGRNIQTFVAALGKARFSGLEVLLEFRPLGFVGCCHLLFHRTGQLRPQTKPLTDNWVSFLVQLGLRTGFVHLKRLFGGEVKRIAVSQSHGIQSGFLLWVMP